MKPKNGVLGILLSHLERGEGCGRSICTRPPNRLYFFSSLSPSRRSFRRAGLSAEPLDPGTSYFLSSSSSYTVGAHHHRRQSFRLNQYFPPGDSSGWRLVRRRSTSTTRGVGRTPIGPRTIRRVRLRDRGQWDPPSSRHHCIHCSPSPLLV